MNFPYFESWKDNPNNIAFEIFLVVGRNYKNDSSCEEYGRENVIIPKAIL